MEGMYAWDLLERLFDQNPYMATMMVDREGKIVFVNETYSRVLRSNSRELVGRPVQEITPDSRTLAALKTAKPLWVIIGLLWLSYDRQCPAHLPGREVIASLLTAFL